LERLRLDELGEDEASRGVIQQEPCGPQVIRDLRRLILDAILGWVGRLFGDQWTNSSMGRDLRRFFLLEIFEGKEQGDL